MLDPHTDIDWTRLVPLHNLHHRSDQDREALEKLAVQAEHYINSFNWCRGVGDGSPDVEGGRWYGEGIAPYLGVFFFQAIVDERWQGLDTWTWLIVGDVPPARVSPWFARNPYQALNCYAGEMRAWVEAVRAGRSVKGLIPVAAAATSEHADLLESRLKLIDEMMLQPNMPLLDAPVAAEREEPPVCRGPGGA